MREDKNRTSRFSTNDAKRMQFCRKTNNYFQNVRGTDKEVREHCIFVSIRLFDQSLRDINNKDNKLNPSDPQHVSCKRLHPPHTSDFSPLNKHLSRKIENRKKKLSIFLFSLFSSYKTARRIRRLPKYRLPYITENFRDN